MAKALVEESGAGEMPFEPIAIVGMGALLPDAPDVETFWQNVLSAKVSFREVRESDKRWDTLEYYVPGSAESKQPNKTYAKIAAWITDYEFDWRRFRVPPGTLRQIDDVQLWAVTTSAQALEDAGFMGEDAPRELPRARTGVVFANAQGGEYKHLSTMRMEADRLIQMGTRRGMTDPEGFRQELTERSPLLTEDTMPGELSNVVAGRVSNLLDLQGPNYTTDAACASSIAALLDGSRLLQSRQVDVAVVGASDRTLEPQGFVKFSAIGALSPTHSRPFDASANGFVMGEGAGAVVCMRLADAIREGHRIYSVVRGIGASSDGKGKGITAPSTRGQQQAISRAYVQAGFGPQTVELFEAHGTSTRVGDATELASLASLLDGDVPPGDHVAIGSIKSQIGHLKSAAGIASLLKSSLALHHATIPPSAGFETPNPAVDWDGIPLFVPTEAREWPHANGQPHRVGVSSFGFGGTNFHVALEAYQPEYHAELAASWEARHARWLGEPADGEPETPDAPSILDPAAEPTLSHAELKVLEGGLLLLSAPDEAVLAERLQATAAALLDPTAGPTFDTDPSGWRLSAELPAASMDFDPSQPRIAIVATSWAELEKRLGLAGQGLVDPSTRGFLARQMVFIETGPALPAEARVAHMYPGQGSQYVGMLEDLAARWDIVEETFTEADRTMRPIIDGKALTPLVFGVPDDPAELKARTAELTATEVCQPAVLTSDLAVYRLLSAHGHEPDMVAGHSLGEYAALMVSGILSFHDALRAGAVRGTEMSNVDVPDTGLMASVTAPYEVIEEVLASIDGYVIPANKNSPQMTVIAGETAAMQEAVQRLSDRGITCVILPTSHAFHSRIVAPASEPLRTFLEDLEINLPRIPITANYDGDFYPAEADGEVDAKERILGKLAPQMASSVEWTKQIETMYEHGARLFLEVGPKRALAGFVPQILGEREYITTNTNHPKQGGVATFLASLGVLALSGRLPQVPRPDDGLHSQAFLAGPVEAHQSSASVGAIHPAMTDAEYRSLRERSRPLPRPVVQAAPAAPAAQAVAAPQPAAAVAPAAAGVSEPALLRREQVHAVVAELSGYPDRHLSDALAFMDLGLDQMRLGALLSGLATQFGVAAQATGLATLGDVVEWAGGRLLNPGELGPRRDPVTPMPIPSPLDSASAVVATSPGPVATAAPAAHAPPAWPMSAPTIAGVPEITGISLGLPGGTEVFSEENFDAMLRGENRITPIPTAVLERILAKGVRKIVKGSDGQVSFQQAETVADLPQLAGQRAHFDLAEQYGIPSEAVRAFDVATQLAFAAGLEALRDAGIPLTPVEKVGKGGKRLIAGWEMPRVYRDSTGVIFASAFPGFDSAIRYVATGGADEDGRFDRRFLLHVLAMGHSQFAQWVGARGPNTAVNAACASLTHAMSVAEDWMRTGRAERVIVVSADDITGEHILEWFGAGFAASGAASIEADVTKAALPFDRRRSGLILGMGAAGIVIEPEGASLERGVLPIARMMGAHMGNSAFHGTRLDTDHVAEQMADFISLMEARWGLDRMEMAPRLAFISHETYTPARGGSASAEIKALRKAFGEGANRIIIANTKGFTGHPMAVGIEEVVGLHGLVAQSLPPIANFQEPDEELGDLRLSEGGPHEFDYVLRLAAGFGSQLAFALYERAATTPDRIDGEHLQAWAQQQAGTEHVDLRLVDRKLVAYVDGASDLLLKGMQGEAFAPVRTAQPVVSKLGGVRSTTGAPAVPQPAPQIAAPAAGAAPAPTAAPTVAAAAPVSSPVAVATGADRTEVEPAVIEVVCEHTGYPTDFIELDQDLEGELGIDTVKQAEIITQLRDRFSLPVDDAFLLSDHPTLEHVIGYILSMSSGAAPASAAPAAPASLPPASSTSAATPAAAPAATQPMPATSGGDPAVPQPAPQIAAPAAGAAPAPTAAPTVAAAAPASSPMAVATGADRAEVEPAVIEVVCEHTGYPTDFIELDQDLEGELGIDTVKQAEIITQLRDRFSLPVDDAFLLSDHPTLEHVIGYILSMSSGAAPASAAPAAPASLPPASSTSAATPAAAPAATQPMPATSGGDPAVARPAPQIAAPATGATPAPTAAPTVTAAAPVSSPMAVATGADRAEVEPAVIEVVCEHTGYPTDFIELDQDLEGELGIDTVKQAEIITQLRDRFSLPVDDAFLLSDHPTLEHVIGYILSMSSGAAPASAAPAAPASLPPASSTSAATPAAAPAATQPMPATSGGDPAVARPAPAAAAPATGATPAPTAAPTVAAAAPASSPVAVATGADRAEVEAAVIEVVCEHTGYPTDFIELDQDLEGELGIDTVKQAEIITQLRDRFSLPVDDAFLLSDHPTMEHVIGYILSMQGASETAAPAAMPTPASSPAPAAEAVAAAATDLSAVAPPAVRAARQVRRWIVGPESAPLIDAQPLDLPSNGLVVITQCDLGLIDELRPMLAERDLRVASVELGLGARKLSVKSGAEPSIRCNPEKPDQLEAAAEALLEAGPVVGIMHLAPSQLATHEPEGPGPASAQTKLVSHSLFGLLKGLDAHLAQQPAGLLLSLSALDGQHGAAGGDRYNPLAGGAAGVVKSYAREQPHLRCRALDVSPEQLVDAPALARRLIAELDQDGPVEIGLDADGHRWRLALYPDELPGEGTQLASDDVWLVSGGGSGVTAASIIGLARAAPDAGATFLLVGRTKLDASVADWVEEDAAAINQRKLDLRTDLTIAAKQTGEKVTIVAWENAWRPYERSLEIHRTLASIRATGNEAHYLRCDVSDAKQVSEVVSKAVDQYGVVTGLVHGAGLEESRLVADKTWESFDRIVRVKVDGWQALWHAIDPEHLRVVVCFTSVAGRFGNGGQTDYAAANSILDLEMQRLAAMSEGPHAVAVAWTGWEDVGMATRGSIAAVFEAAGLEMVPVERGVSMFVNEVMQGGAGRVVACGTLGQLDDEDVFRGPRFEFPAEVVALMEDTRRFSMIDQIIGYTADQRIVGETVLDPEHHLFLTDHSIGGTPYLPGVMALEMFAQHALMLAPGCSLGGVEDARFGLPVKLVRGPVVVRVVAEIDDEASNEQFLRVRARMESDLVNRKGEVFGEPRLHHEAVVRLRQPTWNGEVEALADELGVPVRGEPVFDAAAIYARFFHGPRFQSHGGITSASEVDGDVAVDGIALMRHQLPEPRQVREEMEGRTIFQESLPMLHEAAVQHAGLLAMEFDGMSSLPVAIGRSTLVRVPDRGEEVRMRAVHRGTDEDGVSTADVVLVGEDDRPVLIIEEARLKVMAPLPDDQRFTLER